MTEPVYAFRRRGQDDFCTCTFKRYTELSDFPEKFEMRIFYTAPQPSPTAQAAESAPAVDESYKQALGSKNCMQCCVGYMLGLPLESVPDFVTAGGWDRFASFAESQGYAAVMLEGNHEFEADYLASGATARGTSHMVVMNDGKLVHDPHPSNAGLVEVQCVWLLAKKSGPRRHRDERAAFEASAKAYTSNVSFERDGTDYADMTASLLWHGWKLRASHGQAPAHVLHLVQDAFAEVAMAYPKAFTLHKVGLADTAVRKALSTPTPQAAQQAPAGAWIECWYGSGGKEGYEGWSIVSNEGRSLVAYLGRGVEPDAVTEIVMAHNAAPAAPSTPTSGGWISVERHSDQSVLVVFPSCRLASEFERSLLPASPTIGGESNG